MHEDECLEDDGVHLDLGSGLLQNPFSFIGIGLQLLFIGVEWVRLLVVNAEEVSSLEEKDEQHGDLEDGLTNDVSPHNGVDNGVGLLSRHTLHDFFYVGWLSSESKGSEGVHDQVDPEHLSRSERGLAENASTSEHNEHSDDVYCQLELEELSHIVVDVASIFNSSQDRLEVVIEELDVTGVLGNIGASDAHCKADISSVESRCIVCAITSDSNSALLFDQTVDKHELIIRLGPGHNLELLLNLSELCLVADLALDLLHLLHFLLTVTVFDFFHDIFQVDAATDSLAELLSSHAKVLVLLLVGDVLFCDDASLK